MVLYPPKEDSNEISRVNTDKLNTVGATMVLDESDGMVVQKESSAGANSESKGPSSAIQHDSNIKGFQNSQHRAPTAPERLRSQQRQNQEDALFKIGGNKVVIKN